MGLKDLIAGNIAGPSGFGSFMGRQAIEAGLGLGRTLYLGHSTRLNGTGMFIFDSEDEMKLQQFQPYCLSLLNRPPSEDPSVLSKHARIVSLAIAVQCTMTAASHFMKPPNASTFNRSLGASTRDALHNLNNGITAEDVLTYLNVPVPDSTAIINTERPGFEDALSLYLAEAVRKAGAAIGFQRGGILGFGVHAGRLPMEISNSIGGACNQYRW